MTDSRDPGATWPEPPMPAGYRVTIFNGVPFAAHQDHQPLMYKDGRWQSLDWRCPDVHA